MGRAFREAFVAIVATIAAFLIVLTLAVRLHIDATFAITAAALAMSLGRRNESRDSRTALYEVALLPLLGIVAIAVGRALLEFPLLGAVAFVIGISLSIWLRQFGSRAREAGTLVALPLIAILVVAAPRTATGSPAGLLLAISGGIIALACVRATQFVAARLRFAIPARLRNDGAHAVRRSRTKSGLSATSRLALQMAVALIVAFVVGRVAFPDHWSWVVFTAFIVCSGNRGRGDVVYKSLLRLTGAFAGTLAALAIARLAAPTGVFEAVAIFTALFIGMWLRPLNYAYWALCMTLVVTLLQRGDPNTAVPLEGTGAALGLRLLAILVGAICGIAASWFVLPIRTRSVIYLRLSEALLALDAALRGRRASEDEREQLFATFDHRVADLERVAPPVHLQRRARFVREDADHPSNWIAAMSDCREFARAFAGNGEAALRAVGAARRALGARARPANDSNGSERASGASARRMVDSQSDSLSAVLLRLRATLRAGAQAIELQPAKPSPQRP